MTPSATPDAPTAPPTGTADPTDGDLTDVYSGVPDDDAPHPGESTPEGADPATQLREAVDADGSAPVIVRLREQADMAQVQQQAAQAGRAAAATTARELQGQGGAERLAKRARDADKQARGRLVVDSLQSLASQSQDGVRDLLSTHEAAGAATDIREYWVFNGFSATVDETTLEALADHPDVASVTLDETIELDPAPTETGEPLLPVWSLENINAPDVWGEYGIRGADVVVGVMDSGVDGDHPALAASWRGHDADPDTAWFVPTGENYPQPGDGHGHGTHVAGSIVGAPPGEVTGVAPDAQWIAAKIFTDFGSTNDSIIHAAFEWMLAPGGDPAAAPHVVNNSWGANDPTRTEFWDGVAAWEAAGIVPVFANGNAGPGTGTVGSPGSFPHSIGVGATDIEDRIAWFSSRGPAIWDGETHQKPQVSAPGYDIFSTLPGGAYGANSGTSMAAPHVAGVVALMLSAAPDLSVADVRTALTDTARLESHMAALPNAYGAGVVDAHAAVTQVAHSGLITGAVTDTSGEPVEATITVDDRELVTDPDTGAYLMRLPAGEHELSVRAYGHVTATHEVTVHVDATVNLDVTLDAAGVHSLSGTVTGTDGAVAHARVTVVDTPVEPVHTGDDGQFAVQVADGTYQLHVVAAGYAPATTQVQVDGDTDVTVSLAAAAGPVQPGWAQYQNNPGRTGVSGDDMAAATLQEEWSARAGGDIAFSSPVIADERVFVNADHGELVAFDLTTGDQLWSTAFSANLRGAPAVSDGVVFTGGGVDGGIHAVEAATGEPVWTVETPQRRTLYTAPVVTGGVVYATTGFTPDRSDTVFALDAATGDELWSVDIGTRVFFGPAVADGVVLAASAGSRQLVALDADTGAELWTLTRQQDEFIAGPSVADGTVYSTTSVPPEGFAPGWQGSLIAVDLATGDLQWEVTTHGDGQGTTPVVHGDVVIAGSHGLGVVAAHDRHTGEPLWHYGLPVSGGVSHSVMVTGDGYVIGGAQLDQRLFALDVATGELVWEQQVSANVLAAPAYAEGRLVTAESNGTVRAFHPTGQVAGTVTGPDGPLAATVRLAETGEETEADAETGAFEIAGLPPGDYPLEISHYGFEADTRTVSVRVAQTTTVEATLAPVGDGELTGTVTDVDGQPVAGATVTLAGTPLEPAVSGEDGSYEFATVAAGDYPIEVHAGGFDRVRDTVTVTAGEVTVANYTLERFDVAVVADYQSRITDTLVDAGWRVDQVSFDEIVGTLDAYRAVVVAGTGDDRADADLDRFAQIVTEADEAGTSLVFLDTGGPSYGSIRTLRQVTGDPAADDALLSNRGGVWLEDVADHPITAGLPDTARVPLLQSGSWHAWFSGYSGHTLAALGNDRNGRLGDGVGYQRRTMGSNHILIAAAPAPWTDWEEPVADLLAGAVEHAAQAGYGTVTGEVTDADGAPVAATVEVVDDLGGTVADDNGGYELLLEPGEHVLRVSFLGSETVEVSAVVNAGQVHVRDVTLPTAELGTITGQVTSAGSGAAVSGATVSVTGADVADATTGADGRYVITDVPGGGYDLEVSADGYEPALVDDVDVVDGQVTTVDVALTRAPGVVVVGDRNDEITDFLEGHSIPTEQAGWDVVDDLDGVQVVILHNPPNIDEQQFLAALAAFDEAGVSVIFPADGWATRTRGFDLLVRHTGDPSDYGRLGGFSGPEIFLHNLADHPLFDGLEGDPVQLLSAASEAAHFPDYSGIVLADVAEAGAEPAGIGMAYDVRTPDSVHLLLSGLASTLRNSPEGNWTPDGQRIFLNAVRWAADPGQSGLAGTITDPDGQPVPHARVEVADSSWRAVTDADGAFEIGVPPGEHTLHVRAFGYQDEERTHTVAADQTVDASLQLEVADAGGISGVVESGDGGVLEGVRVDLLGTPRETVTGADGSFSMALVEPGSYELEMEIDEHVRTLVPVEVAVDADTLADVTLRPSPLVGIIDDSDFTNSRDRGKEFLADWGYEVEDIEFGSLDRIGALDLIVANVSDFGLEVSAAQLRDFEEAVNRAGVPVLWMGQHNRGAIQFLHEHHQDPAVIGEGFNDGSVSADVVESGHPLLAGLPDEFHLISDNGRYTFFDEFGGTTVANLVTGDDGDQGGTIAFRGRTTGTVDVLLSTLSVTTWGAPSTRESAALNWTPEAERVFVNALAWAMDAGGIGAEVRGTVHSDTGGTLVSEVEVLETGRTYTGRSGDGTFLVPLQPGTWTLQVEAFGHEPTTVEVSVDAGEAVSENITLTAHAAGAVAGTVTGPDGQPVAGAQVELVDTPLSETTGDDGTYGLDTVPVGEWTVRVTGDGFRAAERPVTVTDGGTATVDVQLTASAPVAVVDTSGSSSHGVALSGLLEGEGHDVTLVARSGLAEMTVEDYELIIFNGTLLASNEDAFMQVLEDAGEAGVSTILTAQHGGNYPLNMASRLRGDPEQANWGFVPEGIDYVPTTGHPIFAGFPAGEPIQLIDNLPNQQYSSFGDWSGETIAHVHGRTGGADLGAGVGYRFSSATSVELLLGSFSSSIYGTPEERWTDDARTIYLNAVAWALDATQAELGGVVTGGGEPLAGATVTAVESGVTDVTGEDGSYTLGLSSGTHTIEASAPGFDTTEETVEVPESGSVTLDFDLAPLPRGAVAGTVTSIDGDPVPDAELVGTGPVEWTVTTAEDGTYTVDDLLEGAYEVTVSAAEFLPATATVVVTADQTATLDITLRPTDVGVLGDVDGSLVAHLLNSDVPATELSWDAEVDLSGFEVVVVNGGSPDEDTFEAVLAAADDAEVSLVFTGTWAVDRGGIRLLEQHTDRVEVGAQGYGDGPVQLTGFDAEHPLFAGLDDPATLIVEGGYYSVLDSYSGGYAPEPLAELLVERDGDDPVTGLAVAADWRTAGSVEVLLSASAVTEAVGPGLGWTDEGSRLLVNAIAWARDAELTPPDAPTLAAEVPVVVDQDEVGVSGTAQWPSEITVLRDGEEVATTETAEDGSWSAQVPLEVGDNTLTAVATNLGGDSPGSAPVTVARWESTWQVNGNPMAWVVRLSLDGAAPLAAPADSATLVVRDADGDVVAEEQMRWTSVFYLAHLARLGPGEFQLSAELEVDGHVLTVDGPDLG